MRKTSPSPLPSCSIGPATRGPHVDEEVFGRLAGAIIEMAARRMRRTAVVCDELLVTECSANLPSWRGTYRHHHGACIPARSGDLIHDPPYLHLANDWLAGEYLRAAEAIEAQAVSQ